MEGKSIASIALILLVVGVNVCNSYQRNERKIVFVTIAQNCRFSVRVFFLMKPFKE